MKNAITTIAIAALTTTALADFTSIDTTTGINGVNLNLEVSDFMGGFAADGTSQLAAFVSDFPLVLSNEIHTNLGVSGSGSAYIEVNHNSPTQVSTQGVFNGVANTFGLQGSAQGGASGTVFFGFTLDSAADVMMDWALTDSITNNEDSPGSMTLYQTDLNGPQLLSIGLNGSGEGTFGSTALSLEAGHYVLLAGARLQVNADQFDGEVLGTAGFEATFTIVPTPSALAALGMAGLLTTHRRR